MNWELYQEDEKFYSNMNQHDLMGKSIGELENGSVVSLYADFGTYLSIVKELESVIVSIEDATNAKFWNGRFSLFTYIDQLKELVVSRGYKISEIHDGDHNHWGITYDIVVKSYSFDVTFEEAEKIYKELYNEVNKILVSDNKVDLVGEIPFTLRKNKHNNQKTLTVHYDCINRKFWYGNTNLEELLSVQHQVVTTNFDNANVVEFDIEQYEGMTLRYEIPMPVEMTRKEAKKWIENEIKKPMSSMLEMKGLLA